MKTNLLKWTVSLAGVVLLTSCGGPKDIDKIADAQNCLDQATAAEADQCVSKVEGLESEAAYLIRCTGKFVKEGFNDSTKLASALSSISGGNTGASGSTAMMAALAFKAESTPALNSSSAQEAFNFCTKSNSKGLILLSGLTQSSTVVAVLGGQDPTTLTGPQLQTLMGTLQSDPVAQAAVGTAVATIYTATCTNSSTTTGNYCEQFDSAIAKIPGGITNTSGIGQQIMICYSNPAAAGCTGF